MQGVRGVLKVMLSSAFIIAFFSLPSPVAAFGGLRHFTRRVFFNKIDLCTQPSYTEILPGLYLSNARAAGDRSLLRHLGITHVLTIETRRLPKSTFEHTNISTLFIRANDSPDSHILPYFPMANAFIDEGMSRGNVIVHCHYGVSRSATLVIAYLMEKYRMSYEQALDFVRQRRTFINPNPGFVRQLKEYERLNYDVNGFYRFEAFMNVTARKHKYKLATLAALLVGILVPIAVFVA